MEFVAGNDDDDDVSDVDGPAFSSITHQPETFFCFSFLLLFGKIIGVVEIMEP